MWNGLDKDGKTNKTLCCKGTDLRILTWIRLMMMMMMMMMMMTTTTTTAVCTALIAYNFHFMTNFRNSDNFFSG
jgi:hypothetical protein